MTDILLETINITKEFSGVRVLDNINIKINKGEIFAIIGENGAGKSTLTKIVNGTYSATSGKIIYEGKEVKTDPAKAKKLGINTIPQEFNLIADLNVYENIFLGQEYQKNIFFLDKKEMKERTRELLLELETDIPADRKIQDLSVAEKQMVEISKAVAYNSKLLIMDEPTTVLTPYEIEVLFKLMRKLKSRGVTIIYISHKLGEVKEIADRVMILRDGEFVGLEKTADIDGKEMANKMVGRELNQMFPAKTKVQTEKVLEVKELAVKGILEDINFDLYKGEILGFAGLIGAGRTELAETLIGIRKKNQGQIIIKGDLQVIDSPVDAVNNKLAYLPEDRQGTGILTNFNLAANITLISLKEYSNILIDKERINQQARRYVDMFNIKTPSVNTNLEYLSGGNQQKVSLAKSLDTRPEIFIFDEPTRGIDVKAKMEIFRFINQLVETGISCIFISSELEEVIGMCNRVVVMKEGRISGILEGNQINEKQIMYYATGLHEEVD